MEVKSLKDLKDLLKLLRAQGVQQYNSPALQLVLNEHLPASESRKSQAAEIMDDEELSPEQEAERLLFYSATPPIETES